MMLFLDTEWADVGATDLVALALVGDELVFYAERKELPEKPTDFVRSVVYPLLTRGHWALEDEDFAKRLRTFIEQATARNGGRQPTIGYDYAADKTLFHYAYCGFAGEGPDAPPVTWCDLNQFNPHYSLGVESYFQQRPGEAERRHHALVDAKAARAGYLAALSKVAS
jgi:hypothetical protein